MLARMSSFREAPPLSISARLSFISQIEMPPGFLHLSPRFPDSLHLPPDEASAIRNGRRQWQRLRRRWKGRSVPDAPRQEVNWTHNQPGLVCATINKPHYVCFKEINDSNCSWFCYWKYHTLSNLWPDEFCELNWSYWQKAVNKIIRTSYLLFVEFRSV